MEILRTHKTAIGWTTTYIKGISPLICTHRIHLEEDAKPSRQPHRRLNPIMKEVVKKEVLKLLDVGVIYPIAERKWVSPTQVVPKKSRVTVVSNEHNELIPTRATAGWRVCIDYRKLNAGIRKYHFPVPFVDQMSHSEFPVRPEWRIRTEFGARDYILGLFPCFFFLKAELVPVGTQTIYLITKIIYIYKRTTTGVMSIKIYTHILSPIYIYKNFTFTFTNQSAGHTVMNPY